MTFQDPTAGLTQTASREYRAGRLVGIDAARGLALLGMFAAHLIDVESAVDWSEPSTWWSIVAGRSSVLFATLAGVSLALVTSRDRPVVGEALTTARWRIAVRGVLIAVLGIGLMLLDTPVAVILTTYGLLFLLLLPALSWRRRTLLIVAGVLWLIASPVAAVSAVGLYQANLIWQQIFLYYPLLTFAAYLLVGLAVGRSNLTSPRLLRTFVAVGGLAATGAYSLGEYVSPGAQLYRSADGDVRILDFLFSAEPHSSTPVDMVGSAGVAIAVIGVCGLLARLPATSLGLAPFRMLARVGALPLSIYSAHLVVIAGLYHSGFLSSLSPTGEVATWACFVAGACVAALLWGGRGGEGRGAFRSGPLERFIGGVAGRVAPGRAHSAPGRQHSAPGRAHSSPGQAPTASTHDWAPPTGPPL